MAKMDMRHGPENARAIDKKLRTKDLIYAGAFAALYIIIMLFVVLVLGMTAVPLYLISPFIMGVVGATVYLLYTLKVHKFGAVLILGVLFTICTGSFNWLAILVCLGATVVAELIIKAGGYQSKKMYLMSYPVFNITMAGPFAMLVTARDEFINIARSYGTERANQMEAMTPDWIWFAQVALAIVGGIIGVVIANKLIKKHFEKAGIV